MLEVKVGDVWPKDMENVVGDDSGMSHLGDGGSEAPSQEMMREMMNTPSMLDGFLPGFGQPSMVPDMRSGPSLEDQQLAEAMRLSRQTADREVCR